MGDCPGKHVDMKREEYKEAKASGREPGFEQELYMKIRQLVDENDRRIERGQRRLLESQGPEVC